MIRMSQIPIRCCRTPYMFVLVKLSLLVGITLSLSDSSGGSVKIGWASHPVFPGEHVSLQGDFTSCIKTPCSVRVSKLRPPAAHFSLTPLQVSNYSLKFRLPSTDVLEFSAYNVTVSSTVPGSSASIALNLPDIWWVQGNQGDSATPGGWLRVFGRSIGFTDTSVPSVRISAATVALEESLAAAMQSRDFGTVARIAAQLRAATATERSKKQTTDTAAVSGSASNPILRLTPSRGGVPITIPAEAVTDGSAQWTATFRLPTSVPQDSYAIAVNNGFAVEYSSMVSFVSPEDPVSSRFPVVSPISFTNGKERIYSVPTFGCAGTLDCDSTAAVTAAIDAANAAGGGTVYFPRGMYFLGESNTGLPALRSGVSLRGEAASLVSVYFKEQQPTNGTKGFTQAPSAYINLVDGATGPNAVENITFYITMYYHSLISVPVSHRNFRLRGVTVRANSFFCMNGPHIVGRGPPGKPGRVADYTWEKVGNLITLHGTNWEIGHCDIYSTWNVIWTSTPGARYGHIHDNVIWNGGAAHWFDQMKQVIFERNRITGISLMAMGNNIDTYGGGYAQHIYHANNHFQQTWGNDREVMTTDNLGAYYAGTGVSVNGTTVHIPGFTGFPLADSQELGGSLAVLDGSGAGQYRRIVSTSGSQITIDRPFDGGVPDSTSFVNVGPFRGTNIFHGTTYVDCGAYQLYAYAMDWITSALRIERGGGILSWGRASAGAYCANLHNQFFDNVIVEGNHVYNYNGSYLYPHGKVVEPYNFGVLASDQRDGDLPYMGPINRQIIFRRNKVMSNGGVVVRGNTADVLVENTVIFNSSVGVTIGPASCVYSPAPGKPRIGCAMDTQNATVLLFNN